VLGKKGKGSAQAVESNQGGRAENHAPPPSLAAPPPSHAAPPSSRAAPPPSYVAPPPSYAAYAAPLPSREQFCMPHGFVELRPFQQQALEIILRARRTGVMENRVTTAAIVGPTSAGKDLLPLALARYCKGTSVLFVPHVCVSQNQLTITFSCS
jgi:hypothetical protein